MRVVLPGHRLRERFRALVAHGLQGFLSQAPGRPGQFPDVSRFRLPSRNRVALTGRMVMNQNIGRMAEGEHQISLNAENLSAGSYILRLNQGAKNSSVKFMVY